MSGKKPGKLIEIPIYYVNPEELDLNEKLGKIYNDIIGIGFALTFPLIIIRSRDPNWRPPLKEDSDLVDLILEEASDKKKEIFVKSV